MKKILIVVDFQNDFCNPKGSLYVDGASMAKESIMKYIRDNNDITSWLGLKTIYEIFGNII
jgi:nicotinamidase-related amidase